MTDCDPQVLPLLIFMFILRFVASEQQLYQVDTCQWENFNASCQVDHVIVITRAHYGRMQFGRCLDQNYGYIGCGVDVLLFVDRECSGRAACQISLPNVHLDQMKKPCPNDLKSYLQVEYYCEQVQTPASNSSQKCRDNTVISSSSGYLSNFDFEDITGPQNCPWLLRVPAGLKYLITLLDFGIWTGSKQKDRLPEKTGICHMYARITEPENGRSSVVCGGEQREKLVYTSKTNQISLELSKYDSIKVYFLIRYEVDGCSEYVPPPYTMTEKHGDIYLAHCKGDSSKKWEVRCEANQWTDSPFNCSAVTSASLSWNVGLLFANSSLLSQNVVIFAIILIAVLIACLILVLGIVVIRRQKNRFRRHDQSGVVDDRYQVPFHQRYHEQYPMLGEKKAIPVKKMTSSNSYSPCKACYFINDSNSRYSVDTNRWRTINEPIYESPDFDQSPQVNVRPNFSSLTADHRVERIAADNTT